MTRVLFVDDEPLVLRSLERALRVQKLPWDTRFVHSADAALELLAREPVDVVIADLRMPDVDGVELLTEVRRAYPGVARLVLSGQVGTEECLRVMRVAHQCFAKPCNIAALRQVVERTALARSRVCDAALADATSALTALPSSPRLHGEVCAALDGGAGLGELAQLISRDIALTAKLVQVVNSAFFAQERKVLTVSRAVTALGAGVIHDLLASVDVFRAFTGGYENLARLDHHAMFVAQLARALAPPQLANDAFLAGMLHDLGELVLVELGTSGDHAKVGAFLLALWGIEDRVVDAIAFHHEPGAVAAEAAALVDVLHVAEIVADDAEVSPDWLTRNDASVLAHARAKASELRTHIPVDLPAVDGLKGSPDRPTSLMDRP